MAKVKICKGISQAVAQSVSINPAVLNPINFPAQSLSAVSAASAGLENLEAHSSPTKAFHVAEVVSVLLKGGSLAGVLCLALLLGDRALRNQTEQKITPHSLPFVTIAAESLESGDLSNASDSPGEGVSEDRVVTALGGPISRPIFSGVTRLFTFNSSSDSVSDVADQAKVNVLADAPPVPDPEAEQLAEAKVLADSRNRTAMSFIAGLIAAHRPSIANCEEVAKHIIELSKHYKVDPFYVAAVISVESRFGETARSKAGAVGLMQLLPTTAAEVAYLKTGTQGRPKLTDGRTNIALGITYLKSLEKQFNGDKIVALAAYNWGPKNVNDVNRSPNRFPKDVKKYATTVLERAEQWRMHFQKTEQTKVS